MSATGIDRDDTIFNLRHQSAVNDDGEEEHTLYSANERGEPVTTEWITSTVIIPLEEAQ